MAKKKQPKIDAAEPIIVAAKPQVTFDRLYVRHFVLQPQGCLTVILRPYSSATETELADDTKNKPFEIEDVFALAEKDAKAAAMIDAIYAFADALVKAQA